MFIFCEENGIELKSFLQPNNELKNALEHIVRAKANELGLTLTSPIDQPYIQTNLDRALGHEYRAFFDICDWLSIILRRELLESLKHYDHETINAVIPSYYSAIRPKFEKICSDIATVRTSKDIGMVNNILAEVEKYNSILAELISINSEIKAKIPSLIDLSRSRRKSDKRAKYWDILKLVLAIVIGAIVTKYVGK